MAPFEVNDTAVTTIGWTSAVMAILHAIRIIRRKFSRDNVEVASDRGETAYLKRLEVRNRELEERADRAFAERNEAIEELGRLRAEVQFLRGHVQTLERKISDCETRIDDLRGGNR